MQMQMQMQAAIPRKWPLYQSLFCQVCTYVDDMTNLCNQATTLIRLLYLNDNNGGKCNSEFYFDRYTPTEIQYFYECTSNDVVRRNERFVIKIRSE